MVLFTVIGVFAVENAADIFISTHTPRQGEIFVWVIVAIISGLVVYEAGEGRGDW